MHANRYPLVMTPQEAARSGWLGINEQPALDQPLDHVACGEALAFTLLNSMASPESPQTSKSREELEGRH